MIIFAFEVEKSCDFKKNSNQKASYEARKEKKILIKKRIFETEHC